MKFKRVPWAISTETTLYNKTGSWRNFRPVYLNKLPPCNHACPAGEKIQGYLDLLNQPAKISTCQKAWELLTEDNPFPSICGRVCFHPCEQSCNRSDFDEPIAIHNIERFIGDFGLRKSLKWKLPKINRRFKIAIIGGGPAGLSCAYHLRRLGYQPTIFEADRKLGGLLSQGIPSYRLPPDIVQSEIKRILNAGVKARLNSPIDTDGFNRLIKEYNAVFVAVGAHKERQLNLPNEHHKSVIPALEFLYNLARRKPMKIGARVGIIGGGNAAMDVARSILRLGKKPIIIYRRTENEMPAIPDEIQEAKEERIEFITLAAPKRIITGRNRVTALECVRIKLGPADKSGRRTPIPIKNSDFRVALDTIMPAIGEEIDIPFLPESLKSDSRIKVLEDGISTSHKAIFAGGDAVTGPKTVAEAIGAGKQAAQIINARLKTTKSTLLSDEKPVTFENLNTAYFEHATRIRPAKLGLPERFKSFKEVYKNLQADQAHQESGRCFSCGVCNKCDNCFVFCPDMSVIKKGGKYEYDYDYCKGCGVCVVECPRNAITLIEEKR